MTTGGKKMNIEVLEKLMEQKKIRSYFKLAKLVNIPYTTLLDLIHGKGLKVTTIKTLADFFNVSIDCLVNPTTYYNVLLENNRIKSYLLLTKEEQQQAFYLLLSYEDYHPNKKVQT